jgi:hypothetical protein
VRPVRDAEPIFNEETGPPINDTGDPVFSDGLLTVGGVAYSAKAASV